MSDGQINLVLHAHLPFIRHPEHVEFLEEDWLFEAISETYVPLLVMMDRLRDDGVPFKLTMTMSPPACRSG
jgi:1,4-alpha-glucan branching enzyme